MDRGGETSPRLWARIMVLGGIAELSLSLWLVVMGLDASEWERKASAWQVNGA